MCEPGRVGPTIKKMEGLLGANELQETLWLQRIALEKLLYRSEILQHVISSGLTSWLPLAQSEVEDAVAVMGAISLTSEVQMLELGSAWGIDGPATLGMIAEAAPEGAWGEVLSSLREGMLSIGTKIREVSEVNASLLRQAMLSAQETLANTSPQDAAYTASGHGALGRSSARLLDQNV